MGIKIAFAIWVIYVLISLSIIGGVIWAVIHFVGKYW